MLEYMTPVLPCFNCLGSMIAMDTTFLLFLSFSGHALLFCSCLSMSSSNSCVDLIFCWIFVCLPHTVAPDFRRCFLTSFSVKPGHVEKKPFCIAFIHDLGLDKMLLHVSTLPGLFLL